jgi:hypothetical protein
MDITITFDSDKPNTARDNIIPMVYSKKMYDAISETIEIIYERQRKDEEVSIEEDEVLNSILDVMMIEGLNC